MADYSSMIGQTYGYWIVVGLSDAPQRVRCKCRCEAVKDVCVRSLLNGSSKSCGCSRPPMSAETKEKLHQAALKRAQQAVGKTINGFYVKSVYQKQYRGSLRPFCIAVCPRCGEETDTLLPRLRHMKMCSACSRNITDFLPEINQVDCSGGTRLTSLRSRCNNKTVNKNSATGVNGVSLMSNGVYRAYINLRRKQYNLGFFKTIEEAQKARKKAESLYKEVLAENGDWELEYAKKLAEIKSARGGKKSASHK